MAIDTTPWDVTEYLGSEEAIAHFLEAILEENDPSLLAAALGDIAKAQGMTQIARDAGLSRESLYKALSKDGNPELGTVMRVMKVMGLRLSAMPVKAA
ncbi:addiction module antidote protein [Elstera sp.]|jgi:probable addiction module antidote protein|uniref:addiction module antidote protein n=1 Tax=Elstera sp. TaxID=1916664 RepID=UPI0037BE7FAB